MNRLVFIVSALISTTTLAATWNCPVKDSTNPPTWPKEYVSIVTTQTEKQISTISYVSKIPNSDGTFTDKSQVIFSMIDSIRGGYKVDYCNPNENEFRDYSSTYSLYSNCGVDPQAFFSSKFTFKDGGDINFTVLLKDGTEVNRDIGFSTCTRQAELSAMVLVNANNTEAKYVANESGTGALASFYTQLKLPESSVSSTVKEKKFDMSNMRFGFSCRSATSANGLLTTSCTFYMKDGANTGDFSTTILKLGNTKSANLGMTQAYSNEFNNVFPGGKANLVLKTEQTGLDSKGSVGGSLTLGFSSK